MFGRETTNEKILIQSNIVDELNEPLEGVHIFTPDKFTGTITDSNGNFSIELEKNTLMYFSYMGMNSENYNTENVPKKIQMTYTENVLNEVFIESKKEEKETTTENNYLTYFLVVLAILTFFKK